MNTTIKAGDKVAFYHCGQRMVGIVSQCVGDVWEIATTITTPTSGTTTYHTVHRKQIRLFRREKKKQLKQLFAFRQDYDGFLFLFENQNRRQGMTRLPRLDQEVEDE